MAQLSCFGDTKASKDTTFGNSLYRALTLRVPQKGVPSVFTVHRFLIEGQGDRFPATG